MRRLGSAEAKQCAHRPGGREQGCAPPPHRRATHAHTLLTSKDWLRKPSKTHRHTALLQAPKTKQLVARGRGCVQLFYRHTVHPEACVPQQYGSCRSGGCGWPRDTCCSCSELLCDDTRGIPRGFQKYWGHGAEPLEKTRCKNQQNMT